MDVVEELIKVPCNGNRPLYRLEVSKAEVAEYPAALDRMNLTKAHALALPTSGPVANPPAPGERPSLADWDGWPMAFGTLLMMASGLVGFFFAKRLSPRIILSLHLVSVFIGSFVLMMLLVPVAHYYPLMGIGVFFGFLGLLKLMGRFESPA
jgi:hypothetical protein